MQACTAVTRNYLAHARTLAASLEEHHPDGVLTVLVIDDDEGTLDERTEQFEIVRPADLALDRQEFRRMAAIYTVIELVCALKPRMLELLLDRGASAALWIDSDIELYAPIEDMAELSETHGIVLTPEVLEPRPEPRWGGHYNAGLLAVGPSGRAFLDWWSERLSRDCIHAVEENLYGDQWWLDVVPAAFDHHILRDPGINVAPWNIDQRAIVWSGARFEVNERPLRAFHFSGFDPEIPDRLSKHPRLDLREHPPLARLCRERAERLLAHGYRDVSSLAYGFARAATGIALDRALRRMYRDVLLDAERSGGQLPPDPFDPAQTAEFTAWLTTQVEMPAVPAARRAAFLIERGPNVLDPARFGVASRVLRRAIRRLLRHHADHQRAVDRALLHALLQIEKRSARTEPPP